MSNQVYQGIPVYAGTNQPYSNVIVAQPIVVTRPLPQWANGFEKEVEIQCQFCNKPIITIPKKEIGTGSYICSLILCVTFPILFCLPFIKESCKDVVHICPICGHNVGVKQYKPCS